MVCTVDMEASETLSHAGLVCKDTTKREAEKPFCVN